jgi:hypothetical protein
VEEEARSYVSLKAQKKYPPMKQHRVENPRASFNEYRKRVPRSQNPVNE